MTASNIITINDAGEVVVIDQPEEKERFIALQSNRRTYDVFDEEDQAVQYLENNTGGTIYRLTYHWHNGDQLPMSKKFKEVK